MKKYYNNSYSTLIILIVIGVLITGCGLKKRKKEIKVEFDGVRAYNDVIYQQSLGPRFPGSEGHKEILVWLKEQLIQYQWNVEIQTIIINGKEINNVIATRMEQTNSLLIGAHYDTRMNADHDPNPDLQLLPVPGANDGASGVAVLLELARIIPDNINTPIQLVFFDAEDNGGIEDWDWIQGSRAYVENMQNPPRAVIIVDMVGDIDLKIYKEYNSNESLLNQIWDQAENIGYGEIFLDEYKHSMLDDHTPFVEKGIPAVNIIDFDYPYWHTTSDTVDKVSSDSLKAAGDTLFSWLLSLENEVNLNK